MKKYLFSFFTIKKYTFRQVSFFAIWDKRTKFTKQTLLGKFVKVKQSEIGKYSRINKFCIISNAVIGKFTGISEKTQIGTGGHPLNMASTSIIFHKKNLLTNKWVKPLNFSKGKIIVGNDVWVGIKCLIMDGVTIGDGAVVAAGSVVTKDVPPYAVVGGVPAKVIKFRFEQPIIDRLLQISWWNFSDDEISEKINFFREPEINMEILDKYFPRK